MKLSKFTTGAAAFALLSFTSVSAWALPVLTFTNTPNTGTLNYDGEGGPLLGDGIGFNSISFTGGTPPTGNSSSLFCNGCLLSFQTGGNTGEDTAVGGEYTFEDGGSFTLTGTANDGTSDIGSPNSEILGGSFTGTPTITVTGLGTGDLVAMGTNTVSSDVLDYFGIGASSFMFDIGLDADVAGGVEDNNGFSDAQVLGSSLDVTAVPEPAQIAMFLFGAGLIGGGLWLRRKPQALHNAV